MLISESLYSGLWICIIIRVGLILLYLGVKTSKVSLLV